MRKPRLRITRLFLSGFILILVGCGSGILRESDARDIQDATEAKLSIGDPKNKVRALLGKPLIDLQSIGVEVYRKAGRDIEYIWAVYPIPVPLPGDKVIGYVFITYDSDNKITELVSNYWIGGLAQFNDFFITAGDYHFLNVAMGEEPATLIGPAITWEELVDQTHPDEACTLVLVMGKCVMDRVSLDGQQIIDLSPAGGYCIDDPDRNLYGTFIRRYIVPGNHFLHVHQQQGHSEIETSFSCEGGETVYAELDVVAVDHWWYGHRLKGEILINKSPTDSIVEMKHLCPILWHQGTWYGPTESEP